MATFMYTARTPSGDIRNGQLDGRGREEVVRYLRRHRLVPVKVEEKKAQARAGRPGSRISTRDIVIFTRQLATMIHSGLPLVQSLDILARQSENRALRRVIETVLYDVESGQTLADALAVHPQVFPALYKNMVAAGEAGGILDTILLRLATFQEKADALRRKIKGAMIYPAVILTVAAAAVTVLLLFVIPTFQEMFVSAGVPMPAPTLIVMAMSNGLQKYWYVILIGMGGLILITRQYYQTAGGRLTLDRVILNVPILGPLQRKTAIARFTRTLGTLVASGVSILDGLEITARTAGNRVVHDAIMSSRTSIAAGETISEPLQKSGVFPAIVVQMIHVGEQTGGLDEMLSRIADFYDEEVDAAVQALLAALEPVMIVFLGVIVGGMVIAMYLPIFDMMNAVR
jgi:type IV pilus assembly protein PilC